ncbi:uncharacterized protein LOC131242106 isoform X2 [Magnolia sinica]|uniref:uncharacterized protein LOC131242106 isoform X2 n=1 Tax=Magnolia sinica TaxID=86752 RepID=UPI0026580DE3|nr:uncharacterized protein LOC131242106 isoform X2 [Magnolia sinica]
MAIFQKSNIIGEEAGQSVIEEYLRKRGYTGLSSSTPNVQNSKFQAYMKPPSDNGLISGPKKPAKTPKEGNVSSNRGLKNPTDAVEPKSTNKGNPSASKKKKAGKSISLAEAAKGSIVFQQGKPCSCQARRHKLVSNCLSCGKIICEQEGEGPCSFCGALVLREGSTYAGLDEIAVPLSDAEAAAEAYAKRLVDYDKNSAARTTVIDDQSDYYEIEGNSWLSAEEKELLMKKRQEIEEAEHARRSKVVMTFDLVGRKVVMNEDEASQLESDYRILRPLEEREMNRIKPNPTIRVQPVFVDPGTAKNPDRGRQNMRSPINICLEISGRVQHDDRDLQHFMADGRRGVVSHGSSLQSPSVKSDAYTTEDDYECSLDYN